MIHQRVKGNTFERDIIKEINGLGCGYLVGSSRMYSRYMDNQMVDIIDHPQSNKPFPDHIQCKSITGYVKYDDIFSQFKLLDKPLVVFHRLTEKRKTRFFTIQDYVIMKKEDFYDIIKKLNNVKGI